MNYLSKLKYCFQYQLRKERWLYILRDFGELWKVFGLGILASIGIVLFIPFRLLTQFLQPFWIAYIITDDQYARLKQILYDNSPKGKMELQLKQEQRKQDLLKRLGGSCVSDDDGED